MGANDTSRVEQAFRWVFEDRRTGKIVIGQSPNFPLGLFLCAAVIDLALKPGGEAGTIVGAVKVTSLSVWALDEVARGVNPWRRMLGAATLAYLISSRIG